MVVVIFLSWEGGAPHTSLPLWRKTNLFDTLELVLLLASIPALDLGGSEAGMVLVNLLEVAEVAHNHAGNAAVLVKGDGNVLGALRALLRAAVLVATLLLAAALCGNVVILVLVFHSWEKGGAGGEGVRVWRCIDVSGKGWEQEGCMGRLTRSCPC